MSSYSSISKKKVDALCELFDNNEFVDSPAIAKIAFTRNTILNAVRRERSIKTMTEIVQVLRLPTKEEQKLEAANDPNYVPELKERPTKRTAWCQRQAEKDKRKADPAGSKRDINDLRMLNKHKNAASITVKYLADKKLPIPPEAWHTATLNIPANAEGISDFITPVDYYGKPYTEYLPPSIDFIVEAKHSKHDADE